MKKNIKDLLSKEEVDFVKRVYRRPNCKIHDISIHVEDGSEYGQVLSLYDKPEKLGLIKCTGGYKWEPVGLEMELFCDIKPVEG